MIQVQISRFGGAEVLVPVEAPPPQLGPGQVRIKVSAAGVNFAEVQMRMGLYPEAPRVPFVPGFEVAGVIAEAAPDVREFRRGERVLAACRFGGYATEIVLPASQVRKTPRRLSDKEAAAIPVSFLTAWIALVDMARVREGDRVLVPGAAGGVGSAMVQVAARAGARVTAVVGSPEKKEKVRALGAFQALTYEELESGRGGDGRDFTLVLEPRGGSHVKDSMNRLAAGGRVVCYGVSSLVSGSKRSIPVVLGRLLQTPLLTPIGLQMTNRGVLGVNLLKLFDSEPGLRMLLDAMDGILDGIQSRDFSPVVGKTFPLSKAGDAHRYLQSRKSVGKVILMT
jgi:NADPH:quinone reductase-like Zn-dependent oxidoreductase